MNDLDMYIAKTQGRLAYFLITILVVLVFGVGLVLLLPNVRINEAVVNLMVQVITGVLGLCGSAVAFFYLRHRPPTQNDVDSDSPKPQPPETKP